MATEQSDTSNTEPVSFGSAYRRGRDDPQYQIDRLRMLCAFSTRLIDTYSRQLRDEQRRTRQIWDAKNWNEQHAGHLQNQITELNKVIEEQRAWNAKLEETHASATRDLKDWIGKLEEAKAYFISQVASEKSRRVELESLLDRLHGTWLGRWMVRRIRHQNHTRKAKQA